jgi:hypothetical protein
MLSNAGLSTLGPSRTTTPSATTRRTSYAWNGEAAEPADGDAGPDARGTGDRDEGAGPAGDGDSRGVAPGEAAVAAGLGEADRGAGNEAGGPGAAHAAIDSAAARKPDLASTLIV